MTTAIERARGAVNESAYHVSNDIMRGTAQTLTAFATAEALTRIAVALERVAREIDEDADAMQEAWTDTIRAALTGPAPAKTTTRRATD